MMVMIMMVKCFSLTLFFETLCALKTTLNVLMNLREGLGGRGVERAPFKRKKEPFVVI